ncbi:MAG: response regulator [Candidatus Rokubacteria bacterium]|nr:response regulator [Candidatus Rokubacteria bacterium]
MLQRSGAPRDHLHWVLVVDRDESAADSLARRFQEQGLPAHATTSGQEALRLASLRKPSLAIIDLTVRGMAGVELARRLRALDPELAMVVTTSDRRPALEVEARRVGIVHYAHKPLDLERLDAVTTRAIESLDRGDQE